MIKLYWRKLLCKFGFHIFNRGPTIASLDTYWMQGGEVCQHCHYHRIGFAEASKLVMVAFARGKENSSTHFLAYDNGIKSIVDLYDKKYVQEILDKLPESRKEK